jgi:WD40 repeat protein
MNAALAESERQRGRALTAQERAEKEAKIARATALVAQARQHYAQDNTIALNMGIAAHTLIATEESRSFLLDILADDKRAFYERTIVLNEIEADVQPEFREWYFGEAIAVAFAPDGLSFFGAVEEEILHYTLQGNILRIFRGTGRDFTSLSVTSDGMQLAAGDDDGNVFVWNVQGERVAHIKLPSSIESVVFSPDNKQLLVRTLTHRTRLWSLIDTSRLTIDPEPLDWGRNIDLANLSNGIKIRYQEFPAEPSALAISRDSTYFLVSGADNVIRVWRAADDQLVYRLAGHTGQVLSAAFSPDGQSIVSGGADNTIRIWKLPLYRRQLPTLSSQRITAAAPSPDGRYLLTGDGKGTIVLHDLRKGSARSFANQQTAIERVVFSPDGQHCLTTGKGGKSLLWNIQGKLVRQFDGAGNVATFSDDGRYVITGTGRIWDMTGREIKQCTCYRPKGLALANNGYAFCNDGGVIIFDPQGKRIDTLLIRPNPITAARFSPTGEEILVGTWQYAALYSTTGDKLTDFMSDAMLNESVDHVAFSGDGQLLMAFTNKGQIRIQYRLKSREIGLYNFAVFSSAGNYTRGNMLYADDHYVLIEKDNISLRKDNPIELWTNPYWELNSGLIWERARHFTAEEMAHYGINWTY